MNPELPKPLQEALARQEAGEVHLSPDVLTAFMEHTLTPKENESVTHHLARCSQCREVVFLASAAAGEEFREEKGFATAAGRQAAAVAEAAALSPASARAEPVRRRWKFRLGWVVPVAAAALLVAGTLVVQLSRTSGRQTAASLPVASNRPVPATTETRQAMAEPIAPEPAAKPPANEAVAKAAPHHPAAKPSAEASAPMAALGGPAPPSPSAEPRGAAARAAAPQADQAPLSAENKANLPALPIQNGFVESESAGVAQKAGAPAMFAKSQMGLHSVSGAHALWRIGPDGHLEHAIASDQWTPVLASEPTTFHAVAVIAQNVWAGGDGGVLFHSPDGGEHWSKVSLPENVTITTLRFDDVQHGVALDDRGTRWTTADGGVTWTKR